MASDPIDWASGIVIVDTRTGISPVDIFECSPPVVNMKERRTVPQEMDPTIANQMSQNFVNFNRQMDEAAQRRNNAAGFITEQSQYQFMLQQQLVGAKAAGQLDRDSLAKSRLDAASVATPAVVK